MQQFHGIYSERITNKKSRSCGIFLLPSTLHSFHSIPSIHKSGSFLEGGRSPFSSDG